MVIRRPIVVNNGLVSELLEGDTVRAGNTSTQIVTLSGISGGASISSNPDLSVSLAPQPSGLLLTAQGLAIDGVSLVTATAALASGSAAASLSSAALASGNAALQTAVSALASGNAALENIPTGGGSPILNTVAHTNLTEGDPVGLDDAGGVQLVRKYFESSVNGLTTSGPQTTSTTFQGYLNVVSLGSSTFAIGYGGASGYPTCVIASVSGTTVTYGTPVVVASTSSFVYELSAAGTGKIAFIYPLADPTYSYQSQVQIGTVTGTSVSFGGAVAFGYSNNSYPHGASYDPVQAKLIVFSSSISDGKRYAQSGTISGSSVSFASGNVLISQYWQCSFGKLLYNSAQAKTLFVYSLYVAPVLAVTFMTASGSSLTANNAVTLKVVGSSIGGIQAVYCPAQDKTLIIYKTDFGVYGVLFSLSGATGSFGTPFLITTSNLNFTYTSLTYDSNLNKARIIFKDTTTSVTPNDPVSRFITISGDTATLEPFSYVTTVPATQGIGGDYDTVLSGHLFIIPSGAGDSITGYVSKTPGSAVFIQPTLSGYNNFIGTAGSSVSSGSAVAVNLAGSLINRSAADISPNMAYYVSPSTSGFTTSSGLDLSWKPDAPWKLVGKAVSASGLLLLDSV